MGFQVPLMELLALEVFINHPLEVGHPTKTYILNLTFLVVSTQLNFKANATQKKNTKHVQDVKNNNMSIAASGSLNRW